MIPRVCVVTAGHVSTCPRMLKAADALAGAGYDVRVVSTSQTPWAAAADREVRATRTWQWTVIDYGRFTARGLQIKSGARRRVAQALARVTRPSRAPAALFVRAYSRMHDELVRAIVAEPVDFVYGGTTGALAAVAEAANRRGIPYGLDLEDFHSGEQEGDDADEVHALAERVESSVLPGASVLTASSPMIADAYRAKYGFHPQPIHNTFSIEPDEAADADENPPLRFYWFSQTLGPGRGLEDFIRAAGCAHIVGELHFRASVRLPYLEELARLARATAPEIVLKRHRPAGPDAMVRLARGYDLGLSGEEATVANRRLCLGNKIFTYLAAGVPVLLSATPAQSRLACQLGCAAIVYKSGDIAGLADQLSRFAWDPVRRERARDAARDAALERWHWEHPDDRGALLAAVGAVVPLPPL